MKINRTLSFFVLLVLVPALAFGLTPITSRTITSTSPQTIIGTTPLLTIGDNGTEDNCLTFDGNSDFYSGYDSGDGTFSIGYGGAAACRAGSESAIDISADSSPDVTIPNNLTVTGTTTFTGAPTMNEDLVIQGTTPLLTIGDGGNEDNQVTFNGQTTKDFYACTDNADDQLYIGYGSTCAAQSAFTIDDDTTPDFSVTNSLLATGGIVTISGTTPLLTVGDGGDEDHTIVFNSNTTDYYACSENDVDSLMIGTGSTCGTTPAITVLGQAVTLNDAATVTGATTLNGNVTLGNAATDDITVTGGILGQNALFLDGTTDDAIELIIKVGTDPASADKTLTLPSTSDAAAMISALTTNDVDVANSIWGISNGLAMGGATGADGFELQLMPLGDPGADKYIKFPVLNDAVAVISTLATNDVDVANSIWLISNGIKFEGTAANDANEITLDVANPTADVTYRFPDAAAATYSVMSSTLATNAADIANSVWGGTNQLIFEGTTANDFETIVTAQDVGADATITLPSTTGTLVTQTGLSSIKSYTLDTDSVVLTSSDCGETHAMATAAKTYTLPAMGATLAGCEFTFINAGAATNNIVTVDPNASDQIFGNTFADNGDKTTHIGDTGEAINNTAATADRGDYIKLIGDGADGWYIVGSTGIWAEDTP